MSVVSVLPSSLSAQILNEAITIYDVRVSLVSVDQASGQAMVKLSGNDCDYCDSSFIVDSATSLITSTYDDNLNVAILKEMQFALGSVQIYPDEKLISVINYTEDEI